MRENLYWSQMSQVKGKIMIVATLSISRGMETRERTTVNLLIAHVMMNLRKSTLISQVTGKWESILSVASKYLSKLTFALRFWVYMLLVLYCLAYPAMWICFYQLDISNPFGDKMHYFAILYVLILNLLVVRLVGRYIITAIAYPFSNVCARKFLKK